MKLRVTVLPIVLGLLGATVGATLPGATAPNAVAPFVHAARDPAGSSKKWPGPTSLNWSGYGGVTSGANKVTYTSATWKVPTVAKKVGYSSSWVGVDGFNNSSLIQTGTDQDSIGGGQFVYRAWWEILPAAETIITTLTISPGDTMSGAIRNVSGTTWEIALTDVTKGQTFSITRTYAGPGTSAEWIEEAPSSGSTVLPLAKYSPTQFANITLGLNAATPVTLALQYPGEAIAMVKGKKLISTPSQPTGNSFNVAYGGKQPLAP